jgi:SAM-dependent methyltransferase
MRMLADFMHNNAVTSVVDVGCGDWQFSRVMDWSGIRYQGFDVVDTVIDLNKERFASDNITFATLRSISDLPKADLVVCKDVLQHLPNRDVNEYLDYFSTHYKYAIVTNDIFPDAYTNSDIPHGAGRALRLDQEPFDRRIAVLVRWTITWQEHVWIKDTCLLLGSRGSPTTNATCWWHRLRSL